MTLIRKNKGFFILLLIASAVVLAAGTFSVTYAYLIDSAEKANTVIVGETDLDFTEEFEPPPELKPDISFTKKPLIKNTGNLPCFLRMRVDFSDSAAQSFCTLDINTGHWTLGADGYYYYGQILRPGATAVPLFTTVSIGNVDPSELVEFEILLYAEAVQHDYHNGFCTQNEWDTVWGTYEGGTGA